jgi:hypothetical protein
VFAVYGLKRTGKANLGNMEKITGLEFVPAKRWTSYSCVERY